MEVLVSDEGIAVVVMVVVTVEVVMVVEML